MKNNLHLKNFKTQNLSITRNSIIKSIVILCLLTLNCQRVNAFDDSMRSNVIIHSNNHHIYYKNSKINKLKKGEFVRQASSSETCTYVSTNNGPLIKIDNSTGETTITDYAQERKVNFEQNTYREITGLDAKSELLTHKHGLVSFANGKSKVLKSDLSRGKQYTAMHFDRGTLYIGMAVNGLYAAKIRKSGKSKNSIGKSKLHFKRISKGLPYVPHSKRVFMYEEISSIHTMQNGTLLVGNAIEGSIYIRTSTRNKRNKNKFVALPWPKDAPKQNDVYAISSSKDSKTIWASTNSGLIIYTKQESGEFSPNHIPWKFCLKRIGAGSLASNNFILFQSQTDALLTGQYKLSKSAISNMEQKKKRRIKIASKKRLFYSSAHNFKKKEKKLLNMLKRGNYDGLVLDIKDDFGHIRYKSKVPYLKKIKAIRSPIPLKKFIDKVHKLEKYIVARIVVFKDPVLYRQKGFAIYDIRNNKPWVGLDLERWVDPYNPDLISKYYEPFIKELTEMGIDEIQLDYIRFPSDGGVYRCKYKHKKGDMYFTEALENFLHGIRMATTIPISVDIYGYHGMYRVAGIIGQDIDAYGRHVDVVSPMLYSSHFGNSYMTNRPKADRTYALIHRSVSRGKYIANGKFIIRPYLQAFPMKSSIWGYGKKYFLDQIKASADAGVYGYSFWGSMDHMRKVEKAVEEFRKKKEKLSLKVE